LLFSTESSGLTLAAPLQVSGNISWSESQA